ncbi:MAG: EAL domain-containing protein [Proteobacteria bacterium]|nr:EAL domain-containing protein [Pseudomonadota bacterium]NOG61582.1 EAL domain-containing protein [Pseudomonadota bacterium]
MVIIKNKYLLIAGILMILSILAFLKNQYFNEKELSVLLLLITAVYLISITYYFLMLLQKRHALVLERKRLEDKIIENEKVISEKTQKLETEEKRLKEFSMIIEQSHDAIMVTDAKGEIEYVNEKFSEITGYTSFEILGKNSRQVQPLWVSKENETQFLEVLKKGCAWRSEVTYKKKNGETYWAFESISFIKDANGKVTHFLSTHRDISQEHELSEKLSFHATHDVLTGLVNRREFERRIEQLLSGTSDTEHVVCFIDLDQFKIVNDTCGHVAGDELLRQLSSLLMKTIRKRDLLARLGGDEFGILFENCSLKNAHRVTSSLLDIVQNFQFSWDGRTFKLGASIGIVSVKETMYTTTDILKAADAACYMAKDAGRNRIQVYHAEDLDLAQRQGEVQWVEKINEALDKNLFCLYAQVISPVKKDSDKHYELLIRMSDKNGGIIPPGAFLPAAERYNLISRLDRWVISNAFEFLANNPDFQERINFCSINLSGLSLTENDFLKFVMAGLRDFEINAEKICFEITETAAISNLNVAVKFISTLKKFGCKFALDDFGSGLSSFGYLKNLPVDYLKIDGMFVKDIVDDPIDLAMVKSINEIGHVMGMKTIAEFVENDEIKEILNRLGVDYVQGYGIGKPLPLNELIENNRFDNVCNF